MTKKNQFHRIPITTLGHIQMIYVILMIHLVMAFWMHLDVFDVHITVHFDLPSFLFFVLPAERIHAPFDVFLLFNFHSFFSFKCTQRGRPIGTELFTTIISIWYVCTGIRRFLIPFFFFTVISFICFYCVACDRMCAKHTQANAEYSTKTILMHGRTVRCQFWLLHACPFKYTVR